jgi:hypothetical protein
MLITAWTPFPFFTLLRRLGGSKSPMTTVALGIQEGADTDSPELGRRTGPDRRRLPTRPLDALCYAGRRRNVRRKEERVAAFFVDRCDGLTVGLAIAILLFSILDGVLTLELLDRNSEEANPLMRLLLERGHHVFLLGKYILTAAGLPFLVVYKNWPLFGSRFRAGFCLLVLLGLYLCLLVYQVHLLGR